MSAEADQKYKCNFNKCPAIHEFISGAHKQIYLALKILKETTGAKITSYQLKTELLKVIRRQRDNVKIGETVLKVFKQETNLRT